MKKASLDHADYDLELLAFQIADQEYAVDIMTVREIRGWTEATPLPHAPHYVRGVINLRGAVLPIIDLSARIGMTEIEATTRNVIIVTQNGDKTVGILVDAVSDILSLSHESVQDPPQVTPSDTKSFISGLTVLDERMIRILSLEGVMPETEAEIA